MSSIMVMSRKMMMLQRQHYQRRSILATTTTTAAAITKSIPSSQCWNSNSSYIDALIIPNSKTVFYSSSCFDPSFLKQQQQHQYQSFNHSFSFFSTTTSNTDIDTSTEKYNENNDNHSNNDNDNDNDPQTNQNNTTTTTTTTTPKPKKQHHHRRRRFDELQQIHPKSLKALHRHGLYFMTEIQERTFDPIAIHGKDVVGRARTGTGKTLSYILPTIERIVQRKQKQKQQLLEEEEKNESLLLNMGNENDNENNNPDLYTSSSSSPPPSSIEVLIIVPTRELAAQIGKETERIIAQHNTNDNNNNNNFDNITYQVIYGGSSKREDIERFNTALPTILIATPGRLKDHLASTRINQNNNSKKRNKNKNKKEMLFIDAVQNLQTLILDETDRLLDLGFRNDIQDILACLPNKQKRQTLLFSATLPPSVQSMIEMAVKKDDYELIDCIQQEDPTTHTNISTDQSYIVLPSHRFWSGSMEILLHLMDDNNHDSNSTTIATTTTTSNKNKNKNTNNKKIMVFFPMTSLVQLYADIFNFRFGYSRVMELHGKMHQRSRTTISRKFRNASNAILFTSDVSARGVDYPNVTHVVQIGAADSRETYIHRLGRTGRAGKVGTGLLILPELESSFVHEQLDGLDISQNQDWTQRLHLSSSSSSALSFTGNEEDDNADNTTTTKATITTPTTTAATTSFYSRRLLNQLGPLAQNVRAGRDPEMESLVNEAYQAMIAYYFQRYKNANNNNNNNNANNSNANSNSKTKQDMSLEIVSTINSLVEDLGLKELPAIDKRRAEKIGVDHLPGINIQQRWSDHRRSQNNNDNNSYYYDNNNNNNNNKNNDWSSGWGISPSSRSPSRNTPYGKPYGDFDGKFSKPIQNTNRNENYRDNRDARNTYNNDGSNGSDWKNNNNNNNKTKNRNNTDNHNEWKSPDRHRQPRERGRSFEGDSSHDRRRPQRRGQGQNLSSETKMTTKTKDPFTKLGWNTTTNFNALRSEQNNKNQRGSSPLPRKKGTFQRWETPGEFNFRK